MESIAEALVKIAETEEKVYEAGYLNGYVAGENSASIEIDATLTQEGAAADAKAVGDALLELPHIAPNKDYFHITQEMIENPLESHPYPNNGEYYYKLLDIELDPIVDNLVGTTIFSIDEEGNEITEIININNIYDNRPDGGTSVDIYGNEIDLWIVTEAFDVEMYIDEETTETLSVTKGIWMIAWEEELRVKDIEVPCEVVNRLDEKYLPKTIVGKNVEGKTFIIEDEEVVAESGAEIFNNYLYNIATGQYSHAEGQSTTASGYYSHAEGTRTTASGYSSHAEGSYTKASSNSSHAEGYSTKATGECSHAEGYYTKAGIYKQDENGNYLDKNGNITTNESEYVIIGNYSHAEGYKTTASGLSSHAEGSSTTASGNGSHAEGNGTTASGHYSHAEGSNTTSSGASSHAEGNETTASGHYSHAEGSNTTSSGASSHAEGNETTASGQSSHAEGSYTIADGNWSHAEGYGTKALGDCSHTEGRNTKALGDCSHTEGRNTKAGGYKQDENGNYLDSNGNITTDESKYVIIGHNSHAEGSNTTSSGASSHAEGNNTTSSGHYSHAEGQSTTASGYYSHAEGYYTTASGKYSHAEGSHTIANGDCQHVQGKYNIADTTSAFIIGNGDSNTDRSNAMTVDWDGNAKFAGDVTTGNGNSINGLTTRIGDIDTALDNIISIQESYLIPNGDEVSY